MAKESPEVKAPKSAREVHANIPAKDLQNAFEVTDSELMQLKVNEIAKLLWVGEDATENMKYQRVVRALELYESLEPGDGAEGMLAMQMVGTHDAALECLKRAALPNQTFEGRDMALKHAHKLMTLYTQQLATLNKHRGKGQQKVTVEHVSVAPGGQAIVGTVEAGAKTSPETHQDAGALEHKDLPTLDATPSRKKTRSRKSKS